MRKRRFENIQSIRMYTLAPPHSYQLCQ